MSAPGLNRAAEKARARAGDEERLRQGEVSPQDLQRENLLFHGFRKDVIGFGPKDRPKSIPYLIIRSRD
jgi:hypothetical protein